MDAFLVDPDVDAPLTELVHDGEDLGLVFSGVAGENLWGHRSLGIWQGCLGFGCGNRPRYLVAVRLSLACPGWSGQGNRDRGWGAFGDGGLGSLLGPVGPLD